MQSRQAQEEGEARWRRSREAAEADPAEADAAVLLAKARLAAVQVPLWGVNTHHS